MAKKVEPDKKKKKCNYSFNGFRLSEFYFILK